MRSFCACAVLSLTLFCVVLFENGVGDSAAHGADYGAAENGELAVASRPYELWKAAWVGLSSTGVYFIGTTQIPTRGLSSYGVTDIARCLLTDHLAPARYCECGFHAVYSRRFLSKLYSEDVDPRYDRLAFLRVSLSGCVQEHDDGVRAEEQTVLSVEFSRRCVRCNNRAVALSARSGVLQSSDDLVTGCFPVCKTHARGERIVDLYELGLPDDIPVTFSKAARWRLLSKRGWYVRRARRWRLACRAWPSGATGARS